MNFQKSEATAKRTSGPFMDLPLLKTVNGSRYGDHVVIYGTKGPHADTGHQAARYKKIHLGRRVFSLSASAEALTFRKSCNLGDISTAFLTESRWFKPGGPSLPEEDLSIIVFKKPS